MYIDKKIRGVMNGSSFAEECRALGLDPNKTSLFALECAKLDLNPETTSFFGLECKKYGMNPETTSFYDLEKAGSQIFGRRKQSIRI